MKTYRIIHIAANVIAFGSLGAALVYLLMNYAGLPEPLGVHFSAVNGQFDVFDAKYFAFYPFIMGFVILGALSLLTLAVNRIKKLGPDLNEKGGRVFRCSAVLMIDTMKLAWAVFFSYWTYCVVQQTGMGDGTPLDIFRVFFLLLPFIAIIVFIEITVKYKAAAPVNEKPEHDIPAFGKRFRITHITINIIAAGLLGAFLIYFLLSYSGLPERIGVHFGSSGGFDVYSYKVFGFYPFAAGFGLFGIFSLLSFAVRRIKRTGLNVSEKGDLLIRQITVEILDSMKLIWSLFFSSWAYSVIHQTGMNMTITGLLIALFLLLFPVTAAVIIIISKTHRVTTGEPKNDNPTRN